MDEYYRILNLSPGAPEAEIKKAYRRLARQFHPDVNSSADAEERFIEINEAYEYLVEKRYQSQMVFEYEAPVVDRETQRRERARRYAEKRQQEFAMGVRAFQTSWYFLPVRILRYVVIYTLYAITAIMIVLPFYAWFIAHNGAATVGFGFLAIISSQVYSLARIIDRGTRAYFDKPIKQNI